jgi:hypothetical protein
MAIRPTLVPDASGAPGPRIAVSTNRPRDRDAVTAAIASEAPGRAGDDIPD